MKSCFKKQLDISTIEFLDYCKDGIVDLVIRTFENHNDQKKLLMLKDDDQKTALHLV